jgi:outer membrane protein OmpA-like peptidoglycan-associated protein
MHRSIGSLELVVVALLFVGSGTWLGCSTGAKLRAQAEEIRSTNQSIRDRAVRCAPKEFALAESQIEFGFYELDQGEFKRAQHHIYRAEKYAKLADKLSKSKKCRPQNASMDVDKAEAVSVEGERDQDGDGLIDAEDECPLKPEDFEGFEDKDGCPDTDNDQDGIADDSDRCPNIPEGGNDQYLDEDGCPDPDNDGDGLTDINDNCVNEPEDFDGFEDADGCADQDNDQDGIADTLDQCPNEAEDYDGDVDDDGCPEQRKRVDVTKEEIELNEKVHFAYDKAKIQSQSHPLLKEVAKVLKANPNIQIRIEGHTDSRGSKDYNRELSQRRAQSVVDYLVQQGIARSRMNPKGFGEAKPIASNRTKEGRAANRRVEIQITGR